MRPLLRITWALFAGAMASLIHAAIVGPEARADAPLCGADYALLGYDDGLAGRAPRAAGRARAACASAGLAPPDVSGYRARWRAGAYVRDQNANRRRARPSQAGASEAHLGRGPQAGRGALNQNNLVQNRAAQSQVAQAAAAQEAAALQREQRRLARRLLNPGLSDGERRVIDRRMSAIARRQIGLAPFVAQPNAYGLYNQGGPFTRSPIGRLRWRLRGGAQ